MLEKRKSSRTKMVLPVKAIIGGATHLAHTLDISHSGARIGGIRSKLQVGMMVELQRGPRKAQFHIRWIQELSPTEMRIGIESPEPQETFWGVDLSGNSLSTQTDALMALLSPPSE